ncbi:PQQ-binding-like beta-propeller repeat protein [Kitasatospora sp. NPDC096147]|uniref:outer membrane protein assembly factor BamB family protein n=1 Tax=Kitasatospora sp. NPDC096147 TaxID=3364093 RepID=UPI0038138A9F
MPRYTSAHAVTLYWAGLAGCCTAMATVYFWRGSAAEPWTGGIGWVLGLGWMMVVMAVTGLVVTLARGLHGDGPKGWLVAALCAALGIAPAYFIAGWVLTPLKDNAASPELRAAWSASETGAGRAVAIWQQGETVIRVREDGLTAYRATDGGRLWTLATAPRETVCAAGTDPAGTVAAIGLSRSLGDCKAVRAVDLTAGKWAWGDKVVELADPVDRDRQGRQLAVAGGTVLVAEEERLRALKAADGTELWSSPAGKGCDNQAVAAAGTTVALVEYCAGGYPAGRAALRSLGTADGKQAWSTDLGVETSLSALDFLSVRPPVLRVEERDSTGVRGVVSFTEQGALRAVVKTDGKEHQLLLDPDNRVAGAPGLRAVVTGDQLIAPVKLGSVSQAVAGFSLADGSRSWLVDAGSGAYGVGAGPDGVLALTDYGYDDQLLLIDPRTGATRSRQILTTGHSSATAWLGRSATRTLVGYGAEESSVPVLRGLPR